MLQHDVDHNENTSLPEIPSRSVNLAKTYLRQWRDEIENDIKDLLGPNGPNLPLADKIRRNTGTGTIQVIDFILPFVKETVVLDQAQMKAVSELIGAIVRHDHLNPDWYDRARFDALSVTNYINSLP